MTSAAIRAMKPGPELDAAIAEKVMGWPVCRDPKCDGCDSNVWIDEDGDWHTRRYTEGNKPWQPSTSISDAFEVVERFTDVRIEKAGEGWECEINGWAMARATTAPHAICLAALLAVEKETHDA